MCGPTSQGTNTTTRPPFEKGRQVFGVLEMHFQAVKTVLKQAKQLLRKVPKSFPSSNPKVLAFGVHRQRFKTMAILVDTAKGGGLKGGALASAIHAHSRHGDPDVRQFVHRCDEYPELHFGFLVGYPWGCCPQSGFFSRCWKSILGSSFEEENSFCPWIEMETKPGQNKRL